MSEFRHDVQYNVWHIKGDMCDKQRYKAEFKIHSCGKEYEKQHQRYASNDLGVDDRHICDVHDNCFWDFAHIVYSDSGKGAEYCGYYACGYGDDKRVYQRGYYDIVLEKLFVPVQREAAENAAAF